jgi:hypothetical protein
MILLERYLLQIERYLPFKERKDTITELRSLILDQVDTLVSAGEPEEKAIYKVLLDLGDPKTVANGYHEIRPVISKELEPILMLVLKIVSISLPLTILFAGALSFVLSTNDFTFMDFILDIAYNIPSALYALVMGLGSVFIIFYLIDRFAQPKFEFEEKIFNPDLLPDVPIKVFKISLGETIFVILITVLGLYLINYQQGLISVYYDGNKIPLLNDNFDKILPFINVGWLTAIVLHIYYLFSRKRNIPSKTVETILGIYGGVLIIILATSDILNEIIIDGYNLNVLPTILKIVFIIIGCIGILTKIVEYVKMFINLDRIKELDKY